MLPLAFDVMMIEQAARGIVQAVASPAHLVHDVIGNPDWLARAKAFILEGVEADALRPVIARTFSFERIVEAHRYLESNEQFGKIAVRL